MSIYTDEGVPMMAAIELAIRHHVEGGTTWPANEDGSEITVALQGGTWLCTIKPSGASFEVLIERGECVRFYSKLSHILARVRELAEAARREPADRVAKIMPPKPPMPFTLDPDDFLPEEAPTEPTLRELIRALRDWTNARAEGRHGEGMIDLNNWLDNALGKEECDG